MKILSLVGPTGAGKTSVALALARFYQQQFPEREVHLVSVDSRQIYQGLEVVSGVDLPSGFHRESGAFWYPFWRNSTVYIHGVSCILPQEEWSVACFQQFAWNLLDTLSQDHDVGTPGMVIFVGGTGLYHASLTKFDPQLHIKPNHELRARWEGASLTDLQAELQRCNSSSFAHMTQSDQSNPRRLIRQLEIFWAKQGAPQSVSTPITPPKILMELVQNNRWVTYGVSANREQLRLAITKRVKERLKQGALAEVEKLIQFPNVSAQLLTATGVTEIRAYLTHDITLDELVEKWISREYQYAKRQLTWWRRDSDILWFSAQDLDSWQKVVLEL